MKGWQTDAAAEQPETAREAVAWFDAQLRVSAAHIEEQFAGYRLSEALKEVYHLFWDEFSASFLEIVKPAYGQPIDQKTYDAVIGFFDHLLHLLHPFMPFITEELWQHIAERKDGESITVSPSTIGKPEDGDAETIADFEMVKSIITNVRGVRNSKNIAQKEALKLEIVGSNPVARYDSIIQKLANVDEISVVSAKSDGAASFMVGTTELAVPVGNLIDVAAEIEKIEAELTRLEGFLKGIEKKLGNERFVSNAPEAVVALERKKQSDAQSKIATLRETLAGLKK